MSRHSQMCDVTGCEDVMRIDGAHVFTANHIMHPPTATLSTDQSNHSPAFLNFHLRLRLSLDSEDGFRTGCQNVSHKQQSFWGLQSPRWSFNQGITSSVTSKLQYFTERLNLYLYPPSWLRFTRVTYNMTTSISFGGFIAFFTFCLCIEHMTRLFTV